MLKRGADMKHHVRLVFDINDHVFDSAISWVISRFCLSSKCITWDFHISYCVLNVFFVNVEDWVETCLTWSQYCE